MRADGSAHAPNRWRPDCCRLRDLINMPLVIPSVIGDTNPRGVYRGHDEIDGVAGAIKATHPDFQYQPIAEPEELGNGGRVKWVAGRPGEPPAYAGTDFIIARDGRIAALYLFFDKLP